MSPKRRGWFVKLLPRDVRETYGEEITELFELRLQEEREHRGRIGVVSCHFSLARDLVAQPSGCDVAGHMQLNSERRMVEPD